MTSRPWTDDRVERLAALWREGLSASEIAGQLGGVTRNAVLGKLHRLGHLGGRRRAAVQPPSRPSRKTPRPRRRAAVTVCSAPAAAPPPAAQLPGLAARLEQLGPRCCRWPIGEPKADGFAFCGREAEAGPYCEVHRRLAYRATAPRRPRRSRAAAR